MGSINITILVLFVLMMIYLAWYDHRTLTSKIEDHSDQKSVIVSIGVLGTFIGIVLGLLDFDAQNIKDSIPPLLNGLKFAFLTSIAGMVISIFVSLMQKKKIAGGDDQLAILKEISETLKLNGFGIVGELKNEVITLRSELKDEQEKTREINISGYSELIDKLEESRIILEQQATNNSLIEVQNEISNESHKLRSELKDEQEKTREINISGYSELIDKLEESRIILKQQATNNSLIEVQNEISNESHKLRSELKDEQEKTRKINISGYSELIDKLEESRIILEQQATNNSLIEFQNDVHKKQTESQSFLREEFGKTNESLEKAIEALSKGATEEIIKALETVISDFNKNLVDQFGDNFKELNHAVKDLLIWQQQYKEMLTNDQKYLEIISTSINNSKDTLEVVASKNSEVQEVYHQLSTLIQTYDTQISSVNQQLVNYVEIGESAVATFTSLEEAFKKVRTLQEETVSSLSSGFEAIQQGIVTQSDTASRLANEVSTQSNSIFTSLEEGFNKVQTLQQETVSSLSSGFETIQQGIVTQSDAASTLSNEIKGQLPESLGKLESTLVGLTNQFANDYQVFLENYQKLIPKE